MYCMLEAAEESFLLTRTETRKQTYFRIPFDVVYYALKVFQELFSFALLLLYPLALEAFPKKLFTPSILYYDWLQRSV